MAAIVRSRPGGASAGRHVLSFHGPSTHRADRHPIPSADRDGQVSHSSSPVIPRLSLTDLRAFQAVARHGSFSRSADELEVSQPYVSAQIGALESKVGVPLFRRASRGVCLTEAGHALKADLAAARLEALRVPALSLTRPRCIASLRGRRLRPAAGAMRALLLDSPAARSRVEELDGQSGRRLAGSEPPGPGAQVHRPPSR